jgi:hypothetical protein
LLHTPSVSITLNSQNIIPKLEETCAKSGPVYLSRNKNVATKELPVLCKTRFSSFALLNPSYVMSATKEHIYEAFTLTVKKHPH